MRKGSSVAQPPFPQPQPEPNLPGQSAGPGLPPPDGEPGLPEPDWGSPVPGEPRPGGDPEPHTPGRQTGGAGEPGIPGGSGSGTPGVGPEGSGGPGSGGPDGERRGGGAAYGSGGGQQPWPPQPRDPRHPEHSGPEGRHDDDTKKDPKDDAPQQVRTAWILYVMAAFAAVLATATTFLPGGRSTTVEQVRDALPGGGNEYTENQLEAAAVLIDIGAVIFSIVIAGLFLLAARQLFKGKQWARALLTAGSIVLVAMGITAALVLFAGGSPAGAPAQADPIPNFIDLAASFCAGLFAGTALWQLYTKDSTAFFQERSGVGKS